jgi:ankyrin repeat protein
MALAKNDDKLFKALIDGGADIYKEDGRGYSSYYSAINSSNEEIVRISKSLKSPK